MNPEFPESTDDSSAEQERFSSAELDPAPAILRECWRCGKFVDESCALCPFCRAELRSVRPTRRDPSANVSIDDAVGSIKIVLVFFTLLLLTSVAYAWYLYADAEKPEGPKEEQEIALLHQMLVVEVLDTLLVLAAIASSTAPRPVRRSDTAKTTAWLIGMPVLATLLGINFLYCALLTRYIGAEPHLEVIQINFKTDFWLVLIAVCLQPAVVEELFFRHLALGHLRKAMSDHGAIWVSAVMFAFAHIYNPLGAPVLILIGAGVRLHAADVGELAAADAHARAAQCIGSLGGKQRMIGELIEQRQKPGMAWAIWLFLAAALAVLNYLTDRDHLIRLALAPLGIGLVCLATTRKAFSMQALDYGLQVDAPTRQFIPFEKLETLYRHDESSSDDSFRFDIIYGDGVLSVPGGLNVASGELWSFLQSQLPSDEQVRLPSSLRPFQAEQVEAFGDDRVCAFRAVPQAPSTRGWFGVLLSLAAMVVGIVWAASGTEDNVHKDWIWIGGITILVGLIALLVTYHAAVDQRKQRGSKTGIGGLVIGPSGFALQQGDLRGKMRWDEITEISFTTSQTIVVRFAGGSLAIKDIFNASLRKIYGILKGLTSAAAA